MSTGDITYARSQNIQAVLCFHGGRIVAFVTLVTAPSITYYTGGGDRDKVSGGHAKTSNAISVVRTVSERWH